MTPASRIIRGDTDQPRRAAFMVSASPAVPAASARAAIATTRYGDGLAAKAHGGWPGRPGSAGSMTDGPATATAKVSATLTALRVSPSRPRRSRAA